MSKWINRAAVATLGLGLTVGACNVLTGGEGDPGALDIEGRPVPTAPDIGGTATSTTLALGIVETDIGSIGPCSSFHYSGATVEPRLAGRMVTYHQDNPGDAPEFPDEGVYDRSGAGELFSEEGYNNMAFSSLDLFCLTGDYSSQDEIDAAEAEGLDPIGLTNRGEDMLLRFRGRSDFLPGRAVEVASS